MTTFTRTNPVGAVTLRLHVRRGKVVPYRADFVTESGTTKINLRFEGKTLSDWDGQYFLPVELRRLLIEFGFRVPEEFL